MLNDSSNCVDLDSRLCLSYRDEEFITCRTELERKNEVTVFASKFQRVL